MRWIITVILAGYVLGGGPALAHERLRLGIGLRGFGPTLFVPHDRSVVFALPHPTHVVVPGPWSPSYPTRYPVDPVGASGTDSTGMLSINGYRVAPAGWLRVHVEPQDTIVLIDGVPVSVDRSTGLSERVGLLTGQHHVEASRSGFSASSVAVEIRQAQHTVVRIVLAPLAPVERGR